MKIDAFCVIEQKRLRRERHRVQIRTPCVIDTCGHLAGTHKSAVARTAPAHSKSGNFCWLSATFAINAGNRGNPGNSKSPALIKQNYSRTNYMEYWINQGLWKIKQLRKNLFKRQKARAKCM
ncbi:MAG: hypothetical protein WEB58_21205 [Planctomycetaceae bacterium]